MTQPFDAPVQAATVRADSLIPRQEPHDHAWRCVDKSDDTYRCDLCELTWTL